MDLSSINLLDLQSSAMKNDPTTIGMCEVLNPSLQEVSDEIRLCLIYSRIEELNDIILDELAWQLDIDWYNATVDIETKRNIVKNAIKVFRHRGTPAAVEDVINVYFGDGQVQEWFEYGGEPYMFKVLTSNPSVTVERANQFATVLNSVKNVRSHLEQIVISLSANLDLYTGNIIHTGDYIQVRQVDQ